jgi:predicted ATPase
VDALRDQTTLLIFDNCEHLLDACAGLIDALLKECPRLRVVATSRQALLLEGEALYHVHSLAIPAGVEDRAVKELADYESVRLFAERAVLAASAFEITERNVRTVIDICQRLDGIPLAIELAAARLDLFKVEELCSQLDRSFDLLTTHTRSVLPRHQTMRTCIEWGWNLLGDAEQDFVRKLAVFSGGWTLQAAQALGIADPLELTAALSKKSFVVVDLQAAHETRYSFHEVIRAYALEKLAEAGEEKAQRDLHLDYYLQLARQFEPALHGVDQRLWLERLFLERHNIRAALEWAARTNVHAGLYLSIRLRTFWECCDLPEEKHWLLML